VKTCWSYVDAVAQKAAKLPFERAEALRLLVQRVNDNGGTIYTAANGGGGTVTDHLALGLSLNVLREAGAGMRAVSLNSGFMLSSAVNDFGADNMFAAQLDTLGEPGDLLVVFSGSGKSANLTKAVARAKFLNMHVAAVVGKRGPVSEKADITIDLETDSNAVAEDVAMMMFHWLYCSFMPEMVK
jgi:D-sedoheptulose 7-phosphate isomerase